MSSQEPATFDDLLQTLGSGDTGAVADVFRRLPRLDEQELQHLADFFDGANATDKMYPYKLTLVPWKRGRPAKRQEANVKAFRYFLMVGRALRLHGGGVGAAVAQVIQETGASRTAVMGAWGKFRRRKQMEE